MCLSGFSTLFYSTASLESRPARKKLQKKREPSMVTNTEAKSRNWIFGKCWNQSKTNKSTHPSLDSQDSAGSNKHSATAKFNQLLGFGRYKTQTMSTNVTEALPTKQSSSRSSTGTTTSNHADSEASSAVSSVPPPEITAPSSMASQAPGPKNPIRRLLGIFAHSKHDSAACLDQFGPTPQIEVGSEQEGSDEEVQVDEDIYSVNSEPNEDDENDRRDFKTIRKIPRKAIEAFVLKLVHPDDEQDSHTCHVTQRKEGSFHHAIFLQIAFDGALQQEFILKIPAHGTAKHWGEFDVLMMRNEAVIMQHIHHRTDCPVPKVIAFDEYINNELGAPYILMEKMSGVSAMGLWLGQPPENLTSGEEHEHLDAGNPSLEAEEKRTNFLRSLAHAMSHLKDLKFAGIGLPVYDEATDCKPEYFAPMWRWHSKSLMFALTPSGPFDTTEEFFLDGLNVALNLKEVAHRDPNSSPVLLVKGLRKVFDIVFSAAPFVTPSATILCNAEETDNTAEASFVLRHDDLDLQNILVDDHGNVTGIIDWDGCMSVPQCIGYTSLPTFLRRDWLPDFDTDCIPHEACSLDHYRDVYAKAMEEFTTQDQTDAKFTRKSAIYQALLAAVHEDSDVKDLVGKLLAEIPDFRRVDVDEVCVRLGRGWPAAEKVLQEKIPELLRPE
ncbi:hypothetical protein N0V83_007866 [Neocucurbitaria cava]|uniref:Aminoglycoside phosphotransferase domain-containing protein n=1 Tax=Neocucurbitaria cava TaxID=798079 RepID=A0A9W8Y2K0_9PLEO|nr:hypothetical protein N0V83_007866 [Neocucurbitaria cava]